MGEDRRPSFNWVRYSMMIEMGSRMQMGTKSLWMTRAQFMTFIQKDSEVDLTGAALEWARRIADPASKSDTRGPNASQRLLVPVEEFVCSFNEKSQLERTEWGIKDKKNPTDGDIQALEDIMGTDHHTFDNEFFGSVGGGRGYTQGGPGAFSARSSSAAGSGSGAVPGGQGVGDSNGGSPDKAPPGHAEPILTPKKKQKVFDISGVVSKFLPELKEKLSGLKTKAEAAQTDAQAAISSWESLEEEWKSNFDEAAQLLRQRMRAMQVLTEIEMGWVGVCGVWGLESMIGGDGHGGVPRGSGVQRAGCGRWSGCRSSWSPGCHGHRHTS